MSDDDAGFLSRWSRRKVQVREGVAVPPRPPQVEPAPPIAPVDTRPPDVPAPRVDNATVAPEPDAERAPTGPTLADVAQLTRESDYARFVAPGVDGDVRNAALKKLFGDPHFNVMDGLDIYIDDYGRPDPLPAGMLRQMAQAHVLGLFTDEEAKDDAPPPAAAADAPPHTESPANEDTDLRLQPDDAAGRRGAEPGAGPDDGRER